MLMPKAIEVENLVFRYHVTEALHRISFSIEAGEIVGLLGPNGAGKSTTLKILTGLLSPGEGRISIQGFLLPAQNLEAKRVLGYVPETASLYESLTAQEYLELIGRIREIEEKALKEKISTLIETFDISKQHPRSFVRGVYLSLWVPTAILFLILLVPCLWFWGLIPAGLFIGFSLALESFYLALGIFLVDGFPFANAFKPSMVNLQPLILFGALIPIGIFAGIQWFVFHNAFRVVAAAIILAGLAYGAAHCSLKELERKLRKNLVLLGYGPSQMFRELE
jgi:ABC-type Fe3+/spermidine/putrescine transport system ATPase subunit